MLTYRKGKNFDRSFVYNILKENMQEYFDNFLPEGWSDKKFSEGFDPDRIRIFQDEGRRVGFIDVEAKGESLYVHNIQTEGLYAANGIFLKKIVENEAKKRGLSKIIGKVFSENKKAINFFKVCEYSIRKDSKLEKESSFWVEKEI